MPEIADVLLSMEARSFWERVYVACVERGYPSFGTPEVPGISEIADTALLRWKERFEKPEGGDA